MKSVVGFIIYNDSTLKYLPFFLQNLYEQSYQNFKIIAQDNSEDERNENRDYLNKYFPNIDCDWLGGNIGFARAYNLMIKRASQVGAKYFIAVNPDMIFDRNMIDRLFNAMEEDTSLGSASPKILKWDFVNNIKTNIIDSCGLKLLPGLRFIDIGQGEVDNGQHDQSDILGPSGAAAIYRMNALEKVKDENGYFDENMFMYKEDCDLAYRLSLAGYKSKLVPDAVVYHDRTASSLGDKISLIVKNRANKSRKVKEWSFLNQQLIFWKFWHTINWKNKLALMWYQIKILFFIIFFEPYLFKQLINLYIIRKKEKIY